MIRWVVSFGTGCGLLARNIERLAEELKALYDSKDYRILNETPASISQILRRRKGRKLCCLLLEAAATLHLKPQMQRFLNLYPPQP